MELSETGWLELFDRERARYEDGMARFDPEQLVRLGNAAYGAGLTLLMLERRDEASEWLVRAAARWRESWEHATPTSWGRPIGAVKATVMAGRDDDAVALSHWALGLGVEGAASPIGRYAAALALLVLDRDADARPLASSLRDRDEFPGRGRRRAHLDGGPRRGRLCGGGRGGACLVRDAWATTSRTFRSPTR